MTTARERMLQLSSLAAGNSARAHFLSIQQIEGSLQVFGELEAVLLADLEVEIEAEMEITLDQDIVVTLDPELEVEVCI